MHFSHSINGRYRSLAKLIDDSLSLSVQQNIRNCPGRNMTNMSFSLYLVAYNNRGKQTYSIVFVPQIKNVAPSWISLLSLIHLEALAAGIGNE